MPSAASGIAFSIFAASLLLALFLARKGTPGRAALVLAGLAPPALLVFLTWNAGDRLGDLRLELRRIHLAGPAPVFIGSDPDSDQIVMAQSISDLVSLGPGFATIQWRGCQPAASPCLRQAGAARVNGIIRITARDGGTGWLGGGDFASHWLCSAGRRIGYEPATVRLTVDGRATGPALPTNGKRTFQVREFVGVGGDSLVLVDENGAVSAIAAGAGAAIVPRSGSCASPPQSSDVVALDRLEKVAVHLVTRPLAIDVDAARAADPAPGSWTPEAWTRTIERRSFRIDATPRAVDLTPDTPDIFRIPHNREAQLRYREQGGRQLSLGNLGPLLLGTTIDERRFPVVGRPLAGKLFQIIELCAGEAGCSPGIRGAEAVVGAAPSILQPNRLEAAFAVVRGYLERQFADREETFGARAGDHVAVRFRTLDLGYFPFSFALLGGLAALVLSATITHPARKASAAVFALLVMIDLLLLLRLLIGFEGALVSPNQRNVLALLAAPTAMFVVPMLAAAFARAGGIAPRCKRLFTLGLGLATVVCAVLSYIAWDWVGGGSFGSQGGLFVASAGLVLVTWVLLFWPGSIGRIANASKNAVAGVEGRTSRWKTLGWIAGVCVVALFAWFMFSDKTRGVAYVPLLFGLSCALRSVFLGGDKDTKARVSGLRAWVAATVKMAPMVLPLGLIGIFFISDAGLGLVTGCSLIAVFAGLFYWLSTPEPVSMTARARAGWMASLTGAAVAGLYALALLAAPPEIDARQGAAVSEQELARLLDSAVAADDEKKWERALQRWLAFASPSTLRQKGTRGTEEARAEFFAMAEYANQGAWGRGWLNQPALQGMGATQTADYAPAVHVITPFGRIGLVALLMVLFASVWTFQQRLGLPPDLRLRLFPLAAISGLWLLAGASLYVSLANIMLVPFTGRNIMMAAPFSVGDLLDGLALTAPAFCLAVWTAVAAPSGAAGEEG